MKRAIATCSVALAVLLLTASCRSSTDLARPETQRQFGVRMAKMNLWREAMFRFKRAAEIEPDNAMAHNNLAVAYEAIGDFDAAALSYREALRLDRSNEYIQKNYSRYVEFTQRSKRREASPPAAAAVSPAATPATAVPAEAAPGDAREPQPAPVPPAEPEVPEAAPVPPQPTVPVNPPGGDR